MLAEFWCFTLSTGVAKEKRRDRSTGTICQRMLTLPGRQSAVLLNTAGRRVMGLQPGENDVSHVTPGVYFVRSVVGGERRAVSVRKVVIQR